MASFDRDRAASLLDSDVYATSLGIELEEVTPDRLVVGMTVEDRHTNFVGVGHGGMVFSLADCAFALASNCEGETALAIDAHIAFTAAARPGSRLTAVASEFSRGRSLATYTIEVTRDDGRPVASFTGTVHIATS